MESMLFSKARFVSGRLFHFNFGIYNRHRIYEVASSGKEDEEDEDDEDEDPESSEKTDGKLKENQ